MGGGVGVGRGHGVEHAADVGEDGGDGSVEHPEKGQLSAAHDDEGLADRCRVHRVRDDGHASMMTVACDAGDAAHGICGRIARRRSCAAAVQEKSADQGAVAPWGW